jgi:hypothetical protein
MCPGAVVVVSFVLLRHFPSETAAIVVVVVVVVVCCSLLMILPMGLSTDITYTTLLLHLINVVQ